MKGESEAFQQSLLKLFQELLLETFDRPASHGSDQGATSAAEHHRPASFLNDLLPETSSTTTDYRDLEAISPEWETLVELGEIPAVQDRFHTLLKHRLQAEIERHPPLFPWESEIQDYEAESSAYAISSSEMSSSQSAPWIGQLNHLNLPVTVPQAVLTQLLRRCQEVAQSSLREGAKLVRAVEDLFPGQDPTLHYLAGLVMTSPVRSGGAVAEKATDNVYPGSYETAEPAQQMVLSLLAAQQILSTLTLTPSLGTPIERQWLTEAGPLTLQVVYQSDAALNSLRVQANLPQVGSLTLRGNDLIAITQRGDAGSLSVELLDLGNTQTCQLEVRLAGYEQEPLVFVVKLVNAEA